MRRTTRAGEGGVRRTVDELRCGTSTPSPVLHPLGWPHAVTRASVDPVRPVMSHTVIYSTSHPMLGGVGHQVCTSFGNYPCDPHVQAWPPLAPGVNPTHLLSVAAAAFGQAMHGLIAPMLNATRFQASPWLPPIVQFAAPPGMPGMPQTYVPYPSHPPQAFSAPYPSAGAPLPRTPSFSPARPEPRPSFTPTKLDPQAFFASAAEILENDVSDIVLAHPAPGEPEPAFFAALKHAGQSAIGELPMADGRTVRAEAIRLDGEAADGSWLLALNIDCPGEPPEHRLIRMHDVKTRPEDGERFLADLKRIDASLAKNRCGEEGRTLGVICHDGATESGAVIAGLNALGEADDMRRESQESGTPMPSPGQFARSQREFLQDGRETRGPLYAQGQDRDLEALTRLIYDMDLSPSEPPSEPAGNLAGEDALIDFGAETSPKKIWNEPARGMGPTVMDQPVAASLQDKAVLRPQTAAPAPQAKATVTDASASATATTAAAPALPTTTTTTALPPPPPSLPPDLAALVTPRSSPSAVRSRPARPPSPRLTPTEQRNIQRLREQWSEQQAAKIPQLPASLRGAVSEPDLSSRTSVGATETAALNRQLAAVRRAASEPALSTQGRAQPLTATLGDLFDLAMRHDERSGAKGSGTANDELGVFTTHLIDRMSPMVANLGLRYGQKPDGRGEQLYIAETLAKAARRAFEQLPPASQARITESWKQGGGAFGSARAIQAEQTRRMAELSHPKSTQGVDTLPPHFDRLARRQAALSYTLAAMEFAVSSANESQV